MDLNHNDKFTNILRSSLTEGVKYLAKEEKSKGYILTYMYIYKLIITEEQLEKIFSEFSDDLTSLISLFTHLILIKKISEGIMLC